MGWFSKVARSVGRATKKAGKRVARGARGKVGKLVRRAVKVGVVAGATSFGGPVAGGIAAKVVL